MKKIICYLRTLNEIETVLNIYLDFGALYIAHDYKEISQKYNKKEGKTYSTLQCQTCGAKSISWFQHQ